MYQLVRSSLASPQLAVGQVVSLGVALGIAELFYKFGSFLLEAVVFLVTWFVLDLVVSRVVPGRQRGVRGIG